MVQSSRVSGETDKPALGSRFHRGHPQSVPRVHLFHSAHGTQKGSWQGLQDSAAGGCAGQRGLLAAQALPEVQVQQLPKASSAFFSFGAASVLAQVCCYQFSETRL